MQKFPNLEIELLTGFYGISENLYICYDCCGKLRYCCHYWQNYFQSSVKFIIRQISSQKFSLTVVVTDLSQICVRLSVGSSSSYAFLFWCWNSILHFSKYFGSNVSCKFIKLLIWQYNLSATSLPWSLLCLIFIFLIF